MDKGYFPYLHNGKKFHTLPDGQCVYRYPKDDGVEIVKVSKELRREYAFPRRVYVRANAKGAIPVAVKRQFTTQITTQRLSL